MIRVFTIGFLLAAAPGLSGAEIRVVAKTASAVGEVPVFAGQVARLELEIWAPVGSEVKILAQRKQIAGTLAAPLPPEITLAEAVKFEQSSQRTMTVSVPIPEFPAPTPLLVEFLAAGSSGPPAPAGRVRMMAYPDDGAAEFRRVLAQAEAGGMNGLTVFGSSPTVRTFLEAQEIPFQDAGTDPPAGVSPDRLYVGELDQEAFERDFPSSRRVSAVVFVPPGELLPGVYRTAGIAKVTLGVLDGLASDPRRQRTFFQILTDTLTLKAGPPAEIP